MRGRSLRHLFQDGNCLLQYSDRGPSGMNPPLIPYAPITRARIHTGTRENGSYNHHSQLAKFKCRYFFAWSNGIVNEEDGGQRVLIAHSADGVTWSDPVCVVGDGNDPVMAQNCIALYATADTLYVVAMEEETTKDASASGMRRIDPDNQDVHAYQYPCCLVDGDKLLIGYSVNKEDIECGVVAEAAAL